MEGILEFGSIVILYLSAFKILNLVFQQMLGSFFA
jgi:hypothetical protein